MIDIDCVKSAVECCLKYPRYTTLIVVNSKNDVYNILNSIESMLFNKAFIAGYRQSFVRASFDNGSLLVITLIDNGYSRGTKTNSLLYDDAIDKKIINEVFRPMLRIYVQNGLNLHPLGYN